MGFGIGKKIAKEGITKEQFLNADFVKQLKEGDKQKLESIFNQFNTNNEGDSKDKLDSNEQMDMLAWFKNIAGKNNKVGRSEMSGNKADGVKYKDYKNFMENYSELAKDGEIDASYFGKKSASFSGEDDTTYYYDGKRTDRLLSKTLSDGTELTTYEKPNGLVYHINTQKDNKEINTYYQYAPNAKKGDMPAQIKVEEKGGSQTTYNFDTKKNMYTPDGGKTFFTLDENGLLKEYKEPPERVEKKVVQEENKHAKTRPQFQKPTSKVHLPSQWNQQRVAKDNNVVQELKLNETYTADEVLDKLMTKFGVDKTKIQADKLKADLIKYNPSIFDKDGNVMEGVDWSKLDFPQNAGTLYKTGAKIPTPAVRKAGGSAPVSRSNPVNRTKQTKNLPQDATTNLPTKASPIKKQTYPFTDGTKWGVPHYDERTGARLDCLPLPGMMVKMRDGGYKQKIFDRTYYYDQNQRLTSVKDSKGNEILTIYRDDSGMITSYNEYEFDSAGNITSDVTRNKNGVVFNYTTYEYEIINGKSSYTRSVDRDVNGNVKSYADYETDSQGDITQDIYRKANGKVDYYYNYSTQKYYNPDGTVMKR